MIGMLGDVIDESCQCSVWLSLQTIYGFLVYRCISTLESVIRAIHIQSLLAAGAVWLNLGPPRQEDGNVRPKIFSNQPFRESCLR